MRTSCRFRESACSFWSGLSLRSSTPARSASICKAPRLSVFSLSSTKVKTSPERSQPKQYQDCIDNHRLLQEVRRLAPRDRALLGLRFAADLDLRSVGQALGLSEGAAGRAVLR